jgi:hypothetical protein
MKMAIVIRGQCRAESVGSLSQFLQGEVTYWRSCCHHPLLPEAEDFGTKSAGRRRRSNTKPSSDGRLPRDRWWSSVSTSWDNVAQQSDYRVKGLERSFFLSKACQKGWNCFPVHQRYRQRHLLDDEAKRRVRYAEVFQINLSVDDGSIN